MNSASNMIAKWYQNAFIPAPPNTCEKMSATPTARVGAPPVRDSSVCSSTALAAAANWSGEMLYPKCATACEADRTVSPMTPAGAFIAKYSPGSMIDAATSAITATNDSMSIEP